MNENVGGSLTNTAAATATAAAGEPADSCVMVIFGASGDLTKRKLIPALCNLARDRLLTKNFAVVGFATGEFDAQGFRAKLTEDLQSMATSPVDPQLWQWLSQRIYFVRGSFDDAAGFVKLRETIAAARAAHDIQDNIFYYLAVAPRFFAPVIHQLETAGLTAETTNNWRRVIVEKPFGRDLESARALNADIKTILKERQIYRIDHYLGKETVQNLLVFRFGNGIFEPIWNRQYIDHVQITAAETVGVETRGAYYETSGALRDMVPNHLFQLVALTAMEPPISFQAEAVRNEQAKVLHAMLPFSPESVLQQAVRGQYGAAMAAASGASVPGAANSSEPRPVAYRTEANVAPDSGTDTFVAMKLSIDNWRWAGVPFYLRTGKRLAQRSTSIVIQFKRAPFELFRQTAVSKLLSNRLVVRIQPNEGISLQFGAKIPGPTMQLGSVTMDFSYAEQFGAAPSTGYERLLYDCMIGDQTLFQRADMVEAGWSIIAPLLDVWSALPPRAFPNYASGSWGPRDADELLAREGRSWWNGDT